MRYVNWNNDHHVPFTFCRLFGKNDGFVRVRDPYFADFN